MDKAFEEIYKEYFTPVYRYLLSLTKDGNTAEELTQETFPLVFTSGGVYNIKQKCKEVEDMKDKAIKLLSLPERIRQRPAVIFGSDDADGVLFVIRRLIDVFADRVLYGQCDNVSVTLHEDDSVHIRCDGLGLILDETEIDDKPAWQHIFCEIPCFSRLTDENYASNLQATNNALFGKPKIKEKYAPLSEVCFDLCCAQFVSAFMQLTTVRNGFKKTVSFEKGTVVGNLEKTPTDEKDHTLIHFKADPTVFSDIRISAAAVCSYLQVLSCCLPGFSSAFSDERDGKTETYFYEKGLLDYAAETVGTHAVSPFFVKEIEANGRDRYNLDSYDAKIRLVFCFADSDGKTDCFHNYRKLKIGGTHLETIKDRIVMYLRWEKSAHASAYTAPVRTEPFDFEDIADRLFIFVQTSASANDWMLTTKEAIKNRMITDMASDLIGQDFSYYLQKNQQAVLQVLQLGET